ncbi:MAG: hypothetical protein FWC26_01125 [Fibromonadales bacterium]|nr:hypothetical protein [Fibromonadales bacterium]
MSANKPTNPLPQPTNPPDPKCEHCEKLEARFNALIEEMKRVEVISNPRADRAICWNKIKYPNG